MIGGVFNCPLGSGIKRGCAAVKKCVGLITSGIGAIWCRFVLFRPSCETA